ALNGLAFPMLQHLGDPRFRQFITPAMTDPTGVTAAAVAPFEPLLRFSPSFWNDPLAAIFNQERHLVYPLTDGEKRVTRVAPNTYLATLPTHYAFGRIPLDGDLLDELVALAGGPNRTEADLTALVQNRTLGNALELSGVLYDRWFRGGPLPDFNLDSDRGYAYLCWAQSGDPPHEPTALVTNANAADPTEVRLDVLP
ncbi:MAG: hypothetical protein M3304_10415, partial [Actinomycetota bacterium]|nr:hypothetical protein [Actinomycetota bacterium]